MFSAFKYVYFVYFVVLRRFGQSYDTDTNENMRTLNNILNMKSWCWDCTDIPDNLAYQKVFVNGALITYTDVIDVPLRIDESNVYEKTNVMYLVFGCKCGGTIKDIMGLLNERLDRNENNMYSIKRDLMSVNMVILKAISMIFDFIEIAPNVLSQESGILKTLLSLNLNVNNLIELDYSNSNEGTRKQFSDKYGRMIVQMINLLERFIISNCSLNFENAKKIHHITVQHQNPTSNFEHEIQELIKYFNNLLDNIGLSESNFVKYNINSHLDKLSKNKFSEIDSSDEDSSDEGSLKKKSTFKNDLNFNIIRHVLTKLYSILNGQIVFSKPIPNMMTDIEYIFSIQRSIVDLIMLIIYQNISIILKELKDAIQNESKSFKISFTNNSQKHKPIYLDKSEIESSKLIQTYEKLFIKAKLLKFPIDFINSIGLILRILKDLPCRYKEIQGLNVIIKHIDQNESILSKSKNILLIENISYLLKNNISSNNNDFKPHTFLTEILSIKYIKHFNQIYKLLRNDFEENDEKMIKNKKILNKLQYITKINNSNKICDAMMPLYAHCFDIHSDIKDQSKDDHAVMSRKLTNVLNLINEVEKIQESSMDDTKTLIHSAKQYLSFNLMNYPKERNIKEKLRRIQYHITNLLDKYQIYNCKSPNYRDSLYKTFKENPENKATYLKNFDQSKKNSKANSPSKKEKRKMTSNFNNVLFKSLVDDLKKTQSLKLHWKGELKTMKEISVDITKNIFDFSSLPKYIVIIFKWTNLVLFYTILDVLHYVLLEKMKKSDSKLLNKIFHDLSLIDFNCSETSEIIAIMNSFISEYKNPFEIIELQMILEENVDKYNHVIEREILLSGKMSTHIKKLNNLVDKLKKTWPNK